MDRKLDEGLKKLKELYEDTVTENQKSKEMFLNIVEPIRNELAEKVDNSTFNAQMKKFLD